VSGCYRLPERGLCDAVIERSDDLNQIGWRSIDFLSLLRAQIAFYVFMRRHFEWNVFESRREIECNVLRTTQA